MENRKIEAHLSADEIAMRRASWEPRAPRVTKGILHKYRKSVSSASEGCVTDE
ncbi:MAG: dihydroxy-acid dehydratase [Bacteroidota bacterium]